MVDRVIVIDFGSQYTQLIARRIREFSVYTEIIPYYKCKDYNWNNSAVKGIILSGGPASVTHPNAPSIEINSLQSRPILGICYGAQLISTLKGGTVESSQTREYGNAKIIITHQGGLLRALNRLEYDVWMSHSDHIKTLPTDYIITAKTDNIPIAAFENPKEQIYGVQFHPEVVHTSIGNEILYEFVVNICLCKQDWQPASFIEQSVKEIKDTVKDQQIICGLSGGVDSTVAAVLLNKAVEKNLHCIFINNGLLRKNEFQAVYENYLKLGLSVSALDASEEFITNLKGIADPEQKRKVIGKTFIDVFEREAQNLGNIQFLAQGTIYPDIIESSGVLGTASVIKSHHNVGGLPEKMKLKVIEPLKYLFKDEVRKVGVLLGISEQFINRHPFPGTGLAIRIIGSISEERIKILQEADHIFVQMLKENGLYDKVWQAFAVLLPIRSVGVMGDERTYEQVLVLRAVNSIDGMTADWAKLPFEFLSNVSSRIINEVKGINRVTYDISSKPPATIEWE